MCLPWRRERKCHPWGVSASSTAVRVGMAVCPQPLTVELLGSGRVKVPGKGRIAGLEFASAASRLLPLLHRDWFLERSEASTL